MQLKIIPSDKVDKQKWDDVLAKSSNCLMYATSAYLDSMADNWDAVIAEDYEFIMPVPWRKKMGVKYFYKAPFIQQLGVFGNLPEVEQIKCFQKILQSNFKYGNYSFNYLNEVTNGNASNNYILSLSSKYSILKHFYNTHLERNLAKAKKHQLQYTTGKINEAIDVFKALYSKKLPALNTEIYKRFYNLCHTMHEANNVIVRKIIYNNETVSIALLLKFKERLYNLMPSTTSKGKDISAGHFLFDSIIKEFAQTGLLLDFEGSDIPGIEFFYKGFGAINQPYSKIHFNNLSYPLRLFKR